MHQRLRRRADGDARVLQLVQQRGRHVLVVEGQHRDALGEGAHGVGVGVVPHPGVADHLGGAVVGVGGQQPQPHAEPDRRLLHHPRQLAAAHDGHGREAAGDRDEVAHGHRA